ncbi:hypothetical protein F5Y18DRAFT_400353 [Xylariaceae sp. FL1019]|nr:hypothetical protein F5Y18DRAFT_400353 [Xylariaceae sp. FL1019]
MAHIQRRCTFFINVPLLLMTCSSSLKICEPFIPPAPVDLVYQGRGTQYHLMRMQTNDGHYSLQHMIYAATYQCDTLKLTDIPPAHNRGAVYVSIGQLSAVQLSSSHVQPCGRATATSGPALSRPRKLADPE